MASIISLSVTSEYTFSREKYFTIGIICMIVAYLARWLITKRFKISFDFNMAMRFILMTAPFFLSMGFSNTPAVSDAIRPTIGLGIGWLGHEHWEDQKAKRKKRKERQ